MNTSNERCRIRCHNCKPRRMGLSTYLSDFREQIDCYENLSADKINRGTVIWKMEANLGEVRTLLADDMENSIKKHR